MNQKARDYLFDNVKALLVFSVVIAHFYRVGTDFQLSSFGGAVYFLSFSYIMQGFLFVSGYFAKNVEKCRETAVKSLLYPYLILMPIMFGVRYLVFGNAELDMITPTMALWFMLTLFYYRWFLKDLIRIRWILPISVLVSLAAGCVPFLDETLSLGRTFGFLPFFIAGYFFQSKHLEKVRDIPKWIGVLVLFLLLGYTVLMAYQAPFGVSNLYMKYGYEACGLSTFEGIGIRMLISLVSIAWIFVFINLTPRGKNFLTVIGQNTMPVYVLHIIIRYAVKDSASSQLEPAIAYFVLALVSCATVYLFSRPIIANAYGKAMDGSYELVKKGLLFAARPFR